jgi:hypothetical protein
MAINVFPVPSSAGPLATAVLNQPTATIPAGLTLRNTYTTTTTGITGQPSLVFVVIRGGGGGGGEGGGAASNGGGGGAA